MNTTPNKKRNWLIALSVLPLLSFANQGTILVGETYFSNALFITLLGVIIFLLIILIALSQVLKNLAQSDFLNKQREKKEDNNSTGPVKTVGVILLCFAMLHANAEGTASHAGDWLIGGIDMFTFYFMLGVILLEVIFVIVLLRTLHFLLRADKPKVVVAEKKTKNILEVLNASVSIEREEEILMDHDYDGIRELDNDLPPWWKYGFYLTVLVAVVYMINYHVTYTGDLQLAEYNKEIEKGKAEVAEYMKKAANNVDETSIKMMGASDVEIGKQTFVATCAACHGKFGEGGVGPNLTDEYWIHGGGLADVFKSIKYGWPDKGMKAWSEDLSPIQMAQIASFIRTLKGTNPLKPKAPQGDLYIEKGATVADSLANPKDSLQLKVMQDSALKVTVPESNKK